MGERLHTKLGNHLAHLALARIAGGDLRLEIAPALLGCPHVGEQYVEHLLIDLATMHDLGRRYADAFLMHLGQGARQRSRHGAADVGVMYVADGEADDLPVMENRLPDVDVGRMRAHEAGVGIVRDADVAFLVVADGADRRSIVEADEPGRTELRRCCVGLAFCRREASREVLRLLDEGRVRRAIQRERHAFGGGASVVLEDLERNLVNAHEVVPFRVMTRFPNESTLAAKPPTMQVVQSR